MQTRQAKRFRWRVYAPLAIVSIVGFVTMILLPNGAEWWWAAGMAVSVMAAAAIGAAAMRSFRCSTCGERIASIVDTGGKPGAAIDFYCVKCDVRWETGLRTGDD